MDKITKDVMLLKSMLSDLDEHIHKTSADNISVCEAILYSEDARRMLHPDFVKEAATAVARAKGRLVKQAEVNYRQLKFPGM